MSAVAVAEVDGGDDDGVDGPDVVGVGVARGVASGAAGASSTSSPARLIAIHATVEVTPTTTSQATTATIQRPAVPLTPFMSPVSQR